MGRFELAQIFRNGAFYEADTLKVFWLLRSKFASYLLRCSSIPVLSVVRKSQAPSSGFSTAAARCLRSIPPVRHRASARALVFGERSLGCLSVFSGSCPRHIILPWQPLPSLCFRRSSRAPWSPLLASLSSYVVMPTARSSLLSLRVPGVGEAPQIAAIAEVGRSPPGPLRFRFFSLGFSLRGRLGELPLL